MTLLKAIDIGKTYPGGVVANVDVNLSVETGSVHAVVGENGAGKSTLMKILFGIEQPNKGEILLNGKKVSFANPKEAIEAGIGMVFQHFSLVPTFTVYENVVLGAEPRNGLKFDRQHAIKAVQDLSEKFNLNVDPLTPVKDLPVGQQQRVEILKALYRDAQILILDEPTAVLAPQEVSELFVAIRSLVAQGKTIIFIAHKLPEVLEISDHIMVMRGGMTVGNVATKDIDEDNLAKMMVGRGVSLWLERKPIDGKITLEINQLCVDDDHDKQACTDLSLRVYSGEIVGLVAVEGNGQAELLEAIAGLKRARSGQILMDGETLNQMRVLERRRCGISSIPEDRLAHGLAPGATVAENLVATKLDKPEFVKFGLLNLKAIHAHAKGLIDQFSIRVFGPDAAAETLSGGNMQKVVVARELAEQPKVLLVNQPTRGVDLGATQFIWQTITSARDKGAAVLLSSTDLSELLALSDRLLVLYKGKIVAAFVNHDELQPETLGTYMLGLSEQNLDEMQVALR